MMMCIHVSHYGVKVKRIFGFSKEKLEMKQKAFNLTSLETL